MKSTLIPLLPHLAPGIPAETFARASTHLVGVGNAMLLAEPLLALIASRQCPGHILIETLDRVPQWAAQGRVLVSGFHSPLEQQVLRSLLRRGGRAVKLLARSLTPDRNYRPTKEEREPLDQDRLLILSAFPQSTETKTSRTTRTNRESALERNRLVLAFATEICSPYVAPGSPLAGLLEQAERPPRIC